MGDRTAIDPTAMGQALGDAGRYPLEGRHVCPFCGTINETMEGPCPQCTMTNTAETRKATKSRIGPWYVLQSRNPAAPGMRYETLLGFVRKGRVKARSIVRGPTTHQLWRFACQVKGLGREFGLCYSCGGSIERDAQLCPQCNRLQDPPADPDVFLESQAAPPVAAAEPAVAPPVPLPRPSPLEALQETRQTPIFKELKLPPLSDFPTISSPPPAPLPEAPVPARAAAPVQAQPAPTDRVAARPPEPAPPPIEARPAAPSPASVASPAPVPPVLDGPPKRKANDVFLSAKDLAAAFQLGFDENKAAKNEDKAARKAAADFDDGSPWSGTGAAHEAARPYRRARRKRRTGRKVLLVLILLIGGATAILALNSRARTASLDWAQSKWMALTGANLYPDLVQKAPSAAARRTPAPAAGARPAAPTGASVVPTPPSDPLTEPDEAPAPQRSAAPSVQAAAPVTSQPSTAPVVREPLASARPTQRVTEAPGDVAPTANPHAPTVTRPAPTTVPSPAPAMVAPAPSAPTTPRPAPAQSQPAPPVRDSSSAAAPPGRTESAPPRMTREDAHRKSRELWNQALDAEERGDYRKAKELYQTIMATLPKDVWYQGIEGRLKFVKDVLGEK